MITIKENFIPKHLLKPCEAWLDKANWVYGWPSNKNIPFGHWNVDISRTGITNPTDIAKNIPPVFKDVWTEINKELYKGQARLTRCYANKHTFGTEGFIHTDTEREEDHTIVVYLNTKWDASWGGETMFYNKDMTKIVEAVLPSYGRVVAFPGTIPHRASPLSRISTGARTTLMFKSTINPKAVYGAEVILTKFLTDIGANKRPHKRGSLMDHLIRCFHILKTTGANDILALSGGLHSVYSTNAYKQACIPFTGTILEETFGPEVDRIVRLFSQIDRPNCLENPDGSINELDLFLLRAIESANLYDQGELDPSKYPNLMEFIKQFTNRG